MSKIKAITNNIAVEYDEKGIISVIDGSIRKGVEWKVCARCKELKEMVYYDGKEDFCDECTIKELMKND